MPQICGRCLEAFRAPVDPTSTRGFVPRPVGRADERELGADDLETDVYAQRPARSDRASSRPRPRLALPMKPLCREDCRGLCPVCGGNRNTAAVRVRVAPARPALAALRDLGRRACPTDSRPTGRKELVHAAAQATSLARRAAASAARTTRWSAPTRSVCPQCREIKLPHRICPHCGFYKGREVISVEG